MTNVIELCKVHSLFTSPNLIQRTAVWNTYVPHSLIIMLQD